MTIAAFRARESIFDTRQRGDKVEHNALERFACESVIREK